MSKAWSKNLLVLIILTISTILSWISLNQSEFANGWDAYYYLVQLQSYVDTGEMHTSEWNLFYPLLIGLHFITDSPVLSAKMLATTLSSAFILSFYYLASRLKSPFLVILVALVFLVFSPSLIYFTAQWPKNLLGLTIYLLFVTALVNRSIAKITLFLVLGFFAHRMTAFLGLITLLLWLFNYNLPSKAKWMILLIGSLSLVAINFAPGLLSIYDIERFNGLLNTTPQIPQFSFIGILGTDKISNWWLMEIGIGFICFIIFSCGILYQLIQKRPPRNIEMIFFSVFLLLWFPFFQLTPESIAYRLFHAGLLLAPILLLFILAYFPYNRRSFIAFSTLFLLFSFFSWKSYNPKKHDPPYKFYDHVISRIEAEWQTTQKPALIIGHKSLAEIITFQTRVDVLPWQPEYVVPENQLYRIAFTPYNQLISYYIQGKALYLGRGYYYLKESHWQDFLKSLQLYEDVDINNRHFDWRNPHEIRPDFLLKN